MALGELTEIDPNLFRVSFTEVAIVHIGLIAWHGNTISDLLCLCTLGTNSHLNPEATVTPRDIFISLHALLHKLKATRTLIWYQRWLQRPQTLTFSASHLTFCLVDVKRLRFIVTEQTGEHHDVCDAFWSIPALALSTEHNPVALIVQLSLNVDILLLVAVPAPPFRIRASSATLLAFRELSVPFVLPLGDHLAAYAEVRVFIWQLPG